VLPKTQATVLDDPSNRLKIHRKALNEIVLYSKAELYWQVQSQHLISPMIEDLLKQLRATVAEDTTLPEATKADLIRHVEAMEAQTSAFSTDASSLEIESEKPVLDQLVTSVEGLEASHPEITTIVNRLANTLGNMGI
jgi:hypothetical protein